MKKSFLFSLVTSAMLMQNAFASLVVTGTRIIYPAKDKEVMVQVNNIGKVPSLAQVWLESAVDSKDIVPFIVTPSISRIDAGSGQSLRILQTNEPLPKDRESLFFFNLLDIPPKSDTATTDNKNYLQLSVRTRLKFIYRPDNLTPSVTVAPKMVDWQLSNTGKNSAQLKVSNPTPYYLTFQSIVVVVNDKKYDIKNVDLVPPKGSETFTIRNLNVNKQNNVTVNYTTINDYGGFNSNTSKVTIY